MTHLPVLLPHPQQITLTGGTRTLPSTGLIALDVPRPADLFETARRVQGALRRHTGAEWTIAGGGLSATLTITLDESIGRREGYRLRINDGGLWIVGNDAAGVFYGAMTLIQLLQTCGATLPTLEIEDWPDFPARGVMLDISRDRVPTMETLYDLIDLLAGWKINQFQLYIEHTFAYQDHREVWQHASPMTAQDILALDAYCRARFVELVPNQNSFGHMGRWFRHARYLPLAETETGVPTPWNTRTEYPNSLSPAVPAALDFLAGLYDELLPNFTSRLFNVGCDETFDLGMGRSRALVEQHGTGRVYLDFLRGIKRLVDERQHTMQFWGDIINQYPDLVPDVPKDAIALEWGYEADYDFDGKGCLFAESGMPFYLCPGTSSWRTIAGRTDDCMGNIRSAARHGMKYGAIGLLNTDWGDEGHWQTLPVSALGFAYGAALSWANTPNETIDLPAALDAFAFHDGAGIMGRLAYDLGNVYQQPGILIANGSVLYQFYRTPLEKLRRHLPAELAEDSALCDRLHATLTTIDQVMAPLDQANMRCEDARLIRDEFALAGQMLSLGARLGLWQAGDRDISRADLLDERRAIIEAFRSRWLARCRPGGLEDSVARLAFIPALDA